MLFVIQGTCKPLEKRLDEREIELRLSEQAIDRMLALGYDPVYGARPMKRLLQSKIETLVARRLVEGDVLPGSTMLVDAAPDGGFALSLVPPLDEARDKLDAAMAYVE